MHATKAPKCLTKLQHNLVVDLVKFLLVFLVEILTVFVKFLLVFDKDC